MIEVPERVTDGTTMIDIQSLWSPINPRKLDTPIGIGTGLGRNNLPGLGRDQTRYFQSTEGNEKSAVGD